MSKRSGCFGVKDSENKNECGSESKSERKSQKKRGREGGRERDSPMDSGCTARRRELGLIRIEGGERY